MSRSIVEYFGAHESYKCGYCGSKDTNYSHGMWAHKLTAEDYQDLIDRGWRRSGKYCYKPIMASTCCPQYTIRCDALKFKLSKSQKKVLKRMKHFLVDGRVNRGDSGMHNMSSYDETDQPMECPVLPKLNMEEKVKQDVDSFLKQNRECSNKVSSCELEKDISCTKSEATPESSFSQEVSTSLTQSACSEISTQLNLCEVEKAGSSSEANLMQTNSLEEIFACPKQTKRHNRKGPDPDKPVCRKGKKIRREKFRQKLYKQGFSHDQIAKMKPKQKFSEKTLEDFISEASVENAAHKLELRLVKLDDSDMNYTATFHKSFALFQQYQIQIHHETKDDCNIETFESFLGETPIESPDDSSYNAFGSYHQQYWLDGQIIAVGVIDILPYCVSSVYLYYDPDYAFLSLGTYAVLREIALTRKLCNENPALKYYYMGFYIHSCPKMKYKGSFSPSCLLCPETYIFKPIELCIRKLSLSKYCRFEEDLEKEDNDGVVDLQDVLVLYKRLIMSYVSYAHQAKRQDEDLVAEYANLIGRKCYERMLLYRS